MGLDLFRKLVYLSGLRFPRGARESPTPGLSSSSLQPFPAPAVWVSPDDSILLPQNTHAVITTGERRPRALPWTLPWNARVKRDKELERHGSDNGREITDGRKKIKKKKKISADDADCGCGRGAAVRYLNLGKLRRRRIPCKITQRTDIARSRAPQGE
ncbi:hypothetical protein PUN28_006643 [Cardiocondyla obscurior]|uniref:Uncharacterized protein n=1 Tax=Cardiocondyla obscurior TaxID=286306 RepID=A0AAW2GC68_9HYME